jgi:hypothetical protein
MTLPNYDAWKLATPPQLDDQVDEKLGGEDLDAEDLAGRQCVDVHGFADLIAPHLPDPVGNIGLW